MLFGKKFPNAKNSKFTNSKCFSCDIFKNRKKGE